MSPARGPNTKFLDFLRSIRPACGAAALLALAFSAVVVVGLLRNLWGTPADPQDTAAFRSLKAALAEDPASNRLKEEIRAADLRLRQEFFHRRAMTRKGAWLLTGGSVVLVMSLGWMLACPPRPAKPASPMEDEQGPRRLAGLGRAGVLAAGLLLAGGAMGWAVYGSGATSLPSFSARQPESRPARLSASRTAPLHPAPTAMAASMPGWEEIRGNWPRFRGPLGAGVYDGQAPTRWDANTGQGILWKQELPLAGHSSPIVWGGRVVVTAADKDARKVLCLDADDGRRLWEKDVKTADSPAKPPEVNEETGYAAPSPATDGNGFCAVFANGDIACFDPGGQQRWARNLHPEEGGYGFASSLDLVEGLVIVQMDQGAAEQGKSRLLALDAKTGAVTWEAPRPVSGSWTSPIVVPLPGHVAVLSLGDPYLIAHDLEDGSELWRAKVGGGDGAPSPILAGGLAFAVHVNYQVAALRPDGNGDVTETHLAWKSEEDIPDIASPLGDGNRLWTLTTSGYLVCYEVATGRRLGERELKGQFQASPSLAGGRLYLLSDTGTMFILEADAEMRPLAQCELGERTIASPAFFHGRIYIRGEKHLFCIGSEGKGPSGG